MSSSNEGAQACVATLAIDTAMTSQVFEEDAHGQTIEPSMALRHVFVTPCSLTAVLLSRRELGFVVEVRVSKALAADRHSARDVVLSWLASSLARRISDAVSLDFFSTTSFDVTELPPPLDDVRDGRSPMATSIELRPQLGARIREAAQYLTALENRFDDARRRLGDLARSGTAREFAIGLGRAVDDLRTIESVLDASAAVGGYSASDARSARRGLEELARRKNENAHGYQVALKSLQTFIFRVSFPTTFRQRPLV